VLEPEEVPAYVTFLVGLAGGPLRAALTTLFASSRPGGSLAGWPGIAGEVGRPLLGLDAFNSAAGPLPIGPLGSVVRVGAQGPAPDR
jgi:hypothetical protein